MSDIPVTDARTFAWRTRTEPIVIDPAYLQLPSELPARVGELAHRITAGITTEYDRVEAVQSWIRATRSTTSTSPRDPPASTRSITSCS